MKRLTRIVCALAALPTGLFAIDGSGDLQDFRDWLVDPLTVDGDRFDLSGGTHLVTSEIRIEKSIKLHGAGVGSTVLQDEMTDRTKAVMRWAIDSVGRVEMTGIEFTGGVAFHDGNKGTLLIEGAAEIVVGDCAFQDSLTQRTILIQKTGAKGVLYNLTLNGENGGVYVRHEGWAGGVGGDGSWESAVDYSSDEFIFIEDCTRTSGAGNSQSIIDGNGGARAVVRYNTVTNGHVLFHGNDSSNKQRSGRAGMAYNNTFTMDWDPGGQLSALAGRGGTWYFFNNTLTGDFNSEFQHKHYRSTGGNYRIWHSPDGLMDWDTNATDDGPATPGGAGDGVYESGTLTAGSGKNGSNEGLVEDTSKAWTDDQWITDGSPPTNYVCRVFENYTVDTVTQDGNGKDVITVTGSPGWTINEWDGWAIVTSTGRRDQVTANTANTLTLFGGQHPPHNLAPTDTFDISLAMVIIDNTTDTLVLEPSNEQAASFYSYPPGASFEIRKVTFGIDMPGAGVSNPWPGDRLNPSDLSQGLDPIYVFGNDSSGVTGSGGLGDYTNGFLRDATHYALEDTHYFTDEQEYIDGNYSAFDGSSGVAVGTAAEMAAITPTTEGVGFWVTDEGEWDSTNPGADGRFYTNVGGTWTLKFTPYTYPHPMRLDEPQPETTSTAGTLTTD